MAVPDPFAGAWRPWPPAALVIALAITFSGCSFDLGSLSSTPDRGEPPRAAPVASGVAEAQAFTIRGEMLARSGNIKEALAEFDRDLDIEPSKAQAVVGRGLV